VNVAFVLYLAAKTVVLWALLSTLAIAAWRLLDSFLTDKGYWP
jgi:hypothetical protein